MDILEIADDNVHGSETLTIELLNAYYESFLKNENISDKIEYLRMKKYEMVQLMNILDIIKKFRHDYEFKKIIDELNKSFSLSVKNSFHIFDRRKIITISWSKLVEEAIKENRDKIDEINILESRPMNEGAKFAEKLSNEGFKVKMYFDAAVYHALDEESIVLVGMDAILPNLELVNKVGTYSLAIASRFKNSKFFAIGTKFKISRGYYEFINHPFNDYKNKGFSLINYYFDITHPDFIDGYIFDFGFFQRSSYRDLKIAIDAIKANIFQ